MKRSTFYAITRMIPAIILTMSAVASFDEDDELMSLQEAEGNFEGTLPWAIQGVVVILFVYFVTKSV